MYKTHRWGWSVTPEPVTRPPLRTVASPPSAPRPVLRGASAARGKQGTRTVSCQDPVADAGRVRAESLQACPTLWTPWTAARQAPPSEGCSRQGCWSGLPRPPPGDLPDPGIEPASLVSPASAGGFFTTSASWEADVSSMPKKEPAVAAARHVTSPFCCFIGLPWWLRR